MKIGFRENENELLECFLNELVFCEKNNLKV